MEILAIVCLQVLASGQCAATLDYHVSARLHFSAPCQAFVPERMHPMLISCEKWRTEPEPPAGSLAPAEPKREGRK